MPPATLCQAHSRRAQADAVVRGRALQVRLLEGGSPQQASVGHAVQGAAARVGDARGGHQRVQALHAVHHRILEAQLARTGQVLLELADRLLATAHVTDGAGELLAVEAAHDDPLLVVHGVALAALVHAEVAGGQAEPAVLRQDQHLLHQLRPAVLAVGVEAHHLVFLAEAGEADELADRGVEEAQGVRQQHAVQHVDAGALAAGRHHAAEVAGAVEGEARGELLEGEQ